MRSFYGQVFSIALARTRDRDVAADLAQEVLVAVLVAVRAGQLRETEKLPQFISGTARNLANNFLRTRQRRAEVELEFTDIADVRSAAEAEQNERVRLIEKGLAQLKPDDQRLLLSILVHGAKPADVAAQLGLSSEVVRARKTRAIKKIMQILGSRRHE